MSTSTKTPASIRSEGGPGASHVNGDQPKEVKKAPADENVRPTNGAASVPLAGGKGKHQKH